jgi:HK97 family phage portal protein
MLSAMDKATFNNIEVMSLDFVKNTLRPLCVMIEQEFNRKLFTEREKRSGTLYTRFNLDGLMRGATKDRFDAYAIAIQNKIMSSNEIRNLENLNPRDGGDKFENPMIQVEENTPPNE